MKRLIFFILLIISLKVSAQQTFWTPGVPPGSTSFSPTFRYSGTDSLANLYFSNGTKWWLAYTAAQQNLRFIRKLDSSHYVTPWQFLHGNNTITGNWNFTSWVTALQYRSGVFSSGNNYTFMDSGSIVATSSNNNLIELYGGAGSNPFLSYNIGGNQGNLKADNITAGRVWQMPDKSGTVLLNTDTGTTSLPSLYSLEHHAWNFYNGATFNGPSNVNFSGANLFMGNGVIGDIGSLEINDTYLDPAKTYGIQNFNGSLQFNRGTEAGVYIDYTNNRLYTYGSHGPGAGVAYALVGDTTSIGNKFIRNSGTLQPASQFNVSKATITGATPASVSTSSGTTAPTSLVFTPPNGGSTSNSSSFASGGNASDLSITMGKGGSTTGAPTTGVGGNGGNIYLLAGDAGDPSGTTKIAGAAGEVIIQGGLSSTNNGANGGNTSIKGGNGYTAANTAGGNVYFVAGQGHGTGLDGTVFSNVSAGSTVRGNTVIANTLDDRLHRLQVTGSAKISDTVIAPKFVVNGTAGAGYAELLSQSVSPSSASGKLRLYSDSLNRLSWKNSTYRRTIRSTRSRDETFTMPYRNDPIIADSTDVKAITDANYAAIGLKQPRILPSFTPSSAGVIASGDSVQRALEKTQYQINTNTSNFANYVAIAGSTSTGQQQIQLTTQQLSLNYDGTNKTAFTTGSTGQLTIAPTGTLVNITGSASVSANLTAGTNTSSFYVPGGTTAVSQSVAQYQYASSSNNYIRTGIYGGTSTSIATTRNYSTFIVGSSPITLASGVTVPWATSIVANTLGTVTNGGGGATITNTASLYVEAPSAAGTNNYSAYINGKTAVNGDVSLLTAGNGLKITEGTNGRVGQVALVAGTKAITISGLTTSSRAFVTLVSPSSASLTIQYQAVCTANTLTIQGNIAAGTINAADVSTINYFIIN